MIRKLIIKMMLKLNKWNYKLCMWAAKKNIYNKRYFIKFMSNASACLLQRAKLYQLLRRTEP